MEVPEAWRVPPLWRGETVFCVASGPSSGRLDLSRLEGRRVIAINDNYLRCPFAGLLYFCDWKWWRWHHDRPAFQAFAGIKASLDERVTQADPAIRWLRNGDSGESGSAGRAGLCNEPDRLKTGRNSGYQALNLAVHLGAKTVVLIGYDMKVGPSGEEHWFGQHRDRQGRAVPTAGSCIAKWAALFATTLPDLARAGRDGAERRAGQRHRLLRESAP